MKRGITVGLLVVAVCIAVLFPFCDSGNTPQRGPNKITLIWNKSYEGQTQNDVRRGMIWTLSWLGAELPKGSFERACEWSDTTRFTINLDSVGFSQNARDVLWQICDTIRNSSEYKTFGGIDIGKFSMLTLGTSEHYYAITGVPETLDEFREKYRIDSGCYVYGVTKSAISEGHRKISFSRDTALFNYGFVAEEGHGSLDDGTFKLELYECFDIMPNGQLRFMIYDRDGDLISGTPLEIGDAGKPPKCLWCHETVIQPLFIENHAVTGMLSDSSFLQIRDAMQISLENYRLSLETDMDWKNAGDHTLGELLYITFMEPTVMHMMNEWGMREAGTRDVLKSLTPYPFKEFDYIGDVYERADVDYLDSLDGLQVPGSARETGSEYNYIRY